MPGNSSGYKNTQKAMNAGAFGAPMASPSASYNQASTTALNNSGIANNNNYSLSAGKGWTNNNGIYSNGNGSQYSYDPTSGWKSLQGYTGATSVAPTPADTYKQQQQAAGTWAGSNNRTGNPFDTFNAWKADNPRPTEGGNMGFQYGGNENGRPTWNAISNADAYQNQYDQQRQQLRDNYASYLTGPGLMKRSDGTGNWGAFGLNQGEIKNEFGLKGDAWDMARGYGGDTVYNANQYAAKFGQPAFNAQGQALTATGSYAGAADGTNNRKLMIERGLRLPGDLEKAFADPTSRFAQNKMSDWLPTAQGGWQKAPDLMDAKDMNKQAYKDALKAFGYQKPDEAGFGSALAGYGNPVLDTSGMAKNPFSGGFTTAAGQANQGILAPPTQQQLKQMYRPGGANFLGGN